MSLRATIAVVLAATVILVSSLGALPFWGSVREPTASGSAPPTLVTDARPIPAGAPTVLLGGSGPVTLTFTLASPHPARLASFLAGVSDPTSPQYRHFLTYSDYLQRFAPTSAEYGQVVGVLRASGAIALTGTADRTGLVATLPAANVDRLLHVTLVQYGRAGGLPLYTPSGPVSLPSALAGAIVGIDGLSDAPASLVRLVGPTSLAPWGERAPTPAQFVHDNATRSDWFVGSDYTQAYRATALFPGGTVANATYPTHVAIATLLASGYNDSTSQNLPPWDPAVVDAYFNQTFPAAWPKPTVVGVPVTIGTVQPPPPRSFGALNDSTPDETENSLDLEMAGSLAPGSAPRPGATARGPAGRPRPRSTRAGRLRAAACRSRWAGPRPPTSTEPR